MVQAAMGRRRSAKLEIQTRTFAIVPWPLSQCQAGVVTVGPPKPGRRRVIFHVDLDCFFASVVLRDRPLGVVPKHAIILALHPMTNSVFLEYEKSEENFRCPPADHFTALEVD